MPGQKHDRPPRGEPAETIFDHRLGHDTPQGFQDPSPHEDAVERLRGWVQRADDVVAVAVVEDVEKALEVIDELSAPARPTSWYAGMPDPDEARASLRRLERLVETTGANDTECLRRDLQTVRWFTTALPVLKGLLDKQREVLLAERAELEKLRATRPVRKVYQVRYWREGRGSDTSTSRLYLQEPAARQRFARLLAAEPNDHGYMAVRLSKCHASAWEILDQQSGSEVWP